MKNKKKKEKGLNMQPHEIQITLMTRKKIQQAEQR